MPDDVLRLRRVEKPDEQLCDDEQFDVGRVRYGALAALDVRKGADDVARIHCDVVGNDDDCAGRKCR
jgi:hypothetical protein